MVFLLQTRKNPTSLRGLIGYSAASGAGSLAPQALARKVAHGQFAARFRLGLLFGFGFRRFHQTGIRLVAGTTAAAIGSVFLRLQAFRAFAVPLCTAANARITGADLYPDLTGEAGALLGRQRSTDTGTAAVKGKAWLDHEWSSEILPAAAQGWDWVSVNFSDGGALMAFRMRSMDGGVLWAGGSVRDRNGRLTILKPEDVAFEPRRIWRSPRTGVDYPVAMRIRAGRYDLEIEPLMDDQELDSSASTGVIYWEGAVRARAGGETIGRGYLELTGYAHRPQM